MKVTFDSQKREKCLKERGLDFKDATEVFSGPTLTFEDDRKDYEEVRYVTVGFLFNRMIIMVWTPRGKARRIISMRKANEREKETYEALLD